MDYYHGYRSMDSLTSSVRKIDLPRRPEEGWVRSVRCALGLSQAKLGRRLGVSKQAVHKAELGEINESITIKRLRQHAFAMDSTLFYVILPFDDSFEELVRRRAREMVEWEQRYRGLNGFQQMTSNRVRQRVTYFARFNLKRIWDR